jgi:hypothetical protein
MKMYLSRESWGQRVPTNLCGVGQPRDLNIPCLDELWNPSDIFQEVQHIFLHLRAVEQRPTVFDDIEVGVLRTFTVNNIKCVRILNMPARGGPASNGSPPKNQLDDMVVLVAHFD